jgi:hypothetical protein
MTCYTHREINKDLRIWSSAGSEVNILPGMNYKCRKPNFRNIYISITSPGNEIRSTNYSSTVHNTKQQTPATQHRSESSTSTHFRLISAQTAESLHQLYSDQATNLMFDTSQFDFRRKLIWHFSRQRSDRQYGPSLSPIPSASSNSAGGKAAEA